MTLIVLALNHSGAEEVLKQRSCPGGLFYYEGYVADRFEHGVTSVDAPESSIPSRGPTA
jgi:hypothetical protein